MVTAVLPGMLIYPANLRAATTKTTTQTAAGGVAPLVLSLLLCLCLVWAAVFWSARPPPHPPVLELPFRPKSAPVYSSKWSQLKSTSNHPQLKGHYLQKEPGDKGRFDALIFWPIVNILKGCILESLVLKYIECICLLILATCFVSLSQIKNKGKRYGQNATKKKD